MNKKNKILIVNFLVISLFGCTMDKKTDVLDESIHNQYKYMENNQFKTLSSKDDYYNWNDRHFVKEGPNSEKFEVIIKKPDYNIANITKDSKNYNSYEECLKDFIAENKQLESLKNKDINIKNTSCQNQNNNYRYQIKIENLKLDQNHGIIFSSKNAKKTAEGIIVFPFMVVGAVIILPIYIPLAVNCKFFHGYCGG